jgi:hypothetical protein
MLPDHTQYGFFKKVVVSTVDRLSIESPGQKLLPGIQRIENNPELGVK